MSEVPLVLVVDDEPEIRRLVAAQVSLLGFDTVKAAGALEALDLVNSEDGRPSVVLSDVDMPRTSGIELLRSIKKVDDAIQVVMITGMHDLGTVRECLREGAYDYLMKPLQLEDLHNTVERAAERFQLLQETRSYRIRLEQMVEVRTQELRDTRDIALMALGKLAESRDFATGRHLERISAFSARLTRALVASGYGEIHELFVEQIERSSALHDIGKVAVPDAILLKPGKLTEWEMSVMRTHTTVGGDTLRSIIKNYEGHDYLTMAMDIAYSHHERWDGTGYPAAEDSDQIPLAARIVAVCDAYDAITSERPYKAAHSHDEAVRRIASDSGTHFDPSIVEGLLSCADDFALIKGRLGDAGA